MEVGSQQRSHSIQNLTGNRKVTISLLPIHRGLLGRIPGIHSVRGERLSIRQLLADPGSYGLS